MKRLLKSIAGMLWLLGLIMPTASFSQTQSSACHAKDMEFTFSQNSFIESDYFEIYHIEKKNKLYYIYAVRTCDVDYKALVRVMNNLEILPDFMPGYRDIELKYNSDTSILAGVVFRPTFSPFTTQFTNAVEIRTCQNAYVQYWRQLSPTDSKILMPYQNEPLYNKGYFKMWPLKNGKVKIVYLSIIEPPVPVPDWVYRFVVRNTYQEVFEALITQAKKS